MSLGESGCEEPSLAVDDVDCFFWKRDLNEFCCDFT
ncbi:hypothetical protein LINGRAHAP2_LOCUS25578, partial [Linum grandiflorum]